jgi:hypothetical protein
MADRPAATTAGPERPGQYTAFELWQAAFSEAQRIRLVLEAAATFNLGRFLGAP